MTHQSTCYSHYNRNSLKRYTWIISTPIIHRNDTRLTTAIAITTVLKAVVIYPRCNQLVLRVIMSIINFSTTLSKTANTNDYDDTKPQIDYRPNYNAESDDSTILTTKTTFLKGKIIVISTENIFLIYVFKLTLYK